MKYLTLDNLVWKKKKKSLFWLTDLEVQGWGTASANGLSAGSLKVAQYITWQKQGVWASPYSLVGLSRFAASIPLSPLPHSATNIQSFQHSAQELISLSLPHKSLNNEHHNWFTTSYYVTMGVKSQTHILRDIRQGKKIKGIQLEKRNSKYLYLQMTQSYIWGIKKTLLWDNFNS